MSRSEPGVDLTKLDDVLKLAELLDGNTALLILSSIVRHVQEDIEAFAANVNMAMNLARVLQGHPVARTVYFSSSAVYGEDIHNTGINEDTAVHPRSYYGAAKLASEFVLRKAVERHPGSTLVILRAPAVYGPGDRGAFYVPSGFLRRAVMHEPIILWGDGLEKREFIYVDDIAGMAQKLTFHRFDGVVNVASGTSYTFRESVDAVSNMLGREVPVESKSRTKVKVDNVFCNQRVSDLLPGFRFTNLDLGLRKTFESDYQSLVSNAD
jgi:UDP-glucose 4-epimerase